MRLLPKTYFKYPMIEVYILPNKFVLNFAVFIKNKIITASD